MGIKRTLIAAWLVATSFSLAPRVTYAQDVGPGREVRAIRHDLPILLAEQFSGQDLAMKTIIASGSEALVEARITGATWVFSLSKRLNTWWLANQIGIDTSGAASTCWGARAADIDGITPEFLKAVGISQSLVDLAEQSFPLAIEAAKRVAAHTPPPSGFVKAGISVDCARGFNILFFQHHPTIPVITEQQYVVALSNDSGPSASLNNVTGRAPTEGESWVTPNNNGYFFFSGTLDSPTTVHVDAGTKLSVWFPFVLDTTKTYSLTIAHVTPVIGPINGTLLRDNTLHFVLPAFTIEPGADIMGEIDGDPYDR